MQDAGREMTREEYDAFVERLPKEARGLWWPVPWRIATARERAVKILLWILETLAIIVGTVILGYIFSSGIEAIGTHTDSKERCLRAAINGLEIQKCDR